MLLTSPLMSLGSSDISQRRGHLPTDFAGQALCQPRCQALPQVLLKVRSPDTGHRTWTRIFTFNIICNNELQKSIPVTSKVKIERKYEWILLFFIFFGGKISSRDHQKCVISYPQRPQQHCWLLTGRVPPSPLSSSCSAPSQGPDYPQCYCH